MDIIIITTPTPTHTEIAIKAVQSGKHIIVEKPLCMKFSDAIKILDALKQENVSGAVVFNYRYFSSVRRGLLCIKKGRLGNIFAIHGVANTRFPTTWTRSTWLYHQWGVIYDFLPHIIDLICIFSSDIPLEVLCSGGSAIYDKNFINYASGIIKFSKGTVATFEASWLTGLFESFLRIYGTGGVMEVDIKFDTLVEIHGGPTPFDIIRSCKEKLLHSFLAFRSGLLFLGAMLLYVPFYIDNLYWFIKKKSFKTSIIDGAINVLLLEALTKSITEKRNVEVLETIKTLLKDYGNIR